MTEACRILIVEDDPGVRLALHDFLIQNGFKDVTAAGDGSQGLSRAKDHPPDLILTDITMPSMDGYTFIQELRNDPALKGVPVIVLTGRGEMADLFKMAEIHNYLIKPVESKELLKMIRRVLGKVEEEPDAHGSEDFFNKIEKIEKTFLQKNNGLSLPKTIKEILDRKQ